jgi:glycosyltransferase involved in cell wall biosynthesis
VNVLLLASHAVAEFDDIRMFHDLGFGIFAPGGYENPATSGEGIRPALPSVPYHADLVAACNRVRAERGEPGPAIDWAKAALPDEVIDWADAIIVHHFVDRWVGAQWDRIKHKRVIWRTCGQSNPELERYMAQFVRDGLQVVRYSPAEARFFERVGAFAGQHALIRFGKYASDYGPWIGDDLVVGNITQDMVGRGDHCGLTFWLKATDGLPVRPAGKGSEHLPGGAGELSYTGMLDYLRHLRTYLYTGTRPASYTLALLEAAFSGVPIVSIGRGAWGDEWGGADLFDVDGIVGSHTRRGAGHPVEVNRNDPTDVGRLLRQLLDDFDMAAARGGWVREQAIALHGMDTIGAQWTEFLR